MYCRVAHYAFFSDLFPARLKLGLDQAHDLPVPGQQLPDRQKHLCQRNKRDING